MDPTPLNAPPPHLNIVDYAVFGIILLSGVLALWRGFVREVLSLGAWIGAAVATVYFYPILRPWMHAHIKSDFGADALTGLTLFCLALAILIPIGYLISGLVRGRALTAIDRSIGFVFGLARGALVVCLLFLITLWVWPDQKKEPENLAQARLRPFMVAGAEELKSFLPKEEMKKMDAEMDTMDKKLKEEPPPSLEELTTPLVAGAKPGKTPTTATDVTTTTSRSGDVTVPIAVTATGTPDNQTSPPMPPTPPSTPPPGR